MDLERASGDWETSNQRSSGEECDEEHRSNLVVGSGNNEGTRGLPGETRSWSVPQASQLGYSAKSRDSQVRIGEPAGTNLANFTAGFLRRGDENTLVRVTIDGKLFR